MALQVTTTTTTPSDLTLTLVAEQPGVNAAPAQVWFEVTNVTGADAVGPTATYDPQFHDILYMWTFDDATNSAPTTTQNMPNIWKDINKAYGRRVAHVYNDAGTYTVTCYAYEPASQKFGSNTIQVVVGDPATIFPTAQTIVYDTSGVTGDWTAIYPGHTFESTWSGVESELTTFASANTPARVMMASDLEIGDRLTIEDYYNFRLEAAQGKTPTISSLGGAGADRTGAPFRDQDGKNIELVLHGLTLQGEWDSTIESGRLRPLIEINKDTYTPDYHQLLVHKCVIDGWLEAENLSSNASDTSARAAYSDCSITNWNNFGIVSRGGGGTANSHIAVLGCSVAQHVDALSGGSKNGVYNQHGPWRDYGAGYTYSSASEFFSRNGWSAGGTGVGIYAGYSITSDQSCIRINTNAGSDRFSYLDRVCCEGKISYAYAGSSDGTGCAPGNHVIDKALVVAGSRQIYGMVEPWHGGCTIRNVLGINVAHDEASFTGGGNTGLVYANSNAGAANDEAGVRVYNCTALDLRGSWKTKPLPVYGSADADYSASYKTLENNIQHAPNVLEYVTVDDPIDTTTAIAGFACRHKGPRIGFQHEEGTFGSTVSDGNSFTIPYSQVKDTIYNRGDVDDGAVTDQNYWTTNGGTDHSIMIEGAAQKYALASKSEMSVSFDASVITITNNSGSDWNSGNTWRLKLDRAVALPAFQSAWTSVGKTTPLARPLTGSAAIDDGDTGINAHDDWTETERPAIGNERGALLEA